MISRVYVSLMAVYSVAILAAGFWMGFRPVAGFANFMLLLLYGLPAIAVLSFVYFTCAAVLVLRGRTKVQTAWPKRVLGLTLIALLLSLPASWIGRRCLFVYAGFDRLRTEADTLMNSASSNRTELAQEKYPPSFNRLGAFRVYVSTSRVDIVNDGWVGRKSGVTVISKNATAESERNMRLLSDRIYSFSWN